MIKLRTYQQDLYDDIQQKLYKDNVKKLCVALPTGGGKSVLIAKLAQELPGRTLILTHRIEILQQNSAWLKEACVLTAKENTLRHDKQIVIAMVQTAFARIKKYGIRYLGDFDNIVLDEVQILIFEKVFEQYDFKRLIGFSGTPVLNKKVYSTVDEIEYVEPLTLSAIFDDLVQGLDTQFLIDEGYLVQDYNIALQLPGFDKLKDSTSNPDGYTKDSLNSLYSNAASVDILKKSYFDYCDGKKTMIFNSSTKINAIVYDLFISLGLNVKMFDTVNPTEINPDTGVPYKRNEIIEWFRNERNAILINTNVFTTGFDVEDVECIIMNRATKSLALWIQIVGRGSRTTDKIFKDKFTVIDLGQNIHAHGIWSMKRDWSKWFHSPGKKRKSIPDLLATWECKECGTYNLIGDEVCTSCGAKKIVEKREGRAKKLKEGTLVEYGEMPLPKSVPIIKYCKSIGEGSNFAYSLLERKIIDLFIHYNVTPEFYSKNKVKFAERIASIYRPIYFAIMRDKELKGANKKLATQLNKVLTKVDKLYNLKTENK